MATGELGARGLAGGVVATTGLGGQIVHPDTRDLETVEGEDRCDPPDVFGTEPEGQFIGLSEKALGGLRCSVRVICGHTHWERTR